MFEQIRVTTRVGLCLICLLASGCSQSDNDSAFARLSRLDLQTYPGPGRTIEEMRGKALVVNFWASWCGPCRREMPALEKLARSLDETRWDVVGISLDRDLYLSQEFLRSAGVTFPNFHGSGTSDPAGAFRIDVLPLTLIIAPDGALRARIVGQQAWDSDATRASLMRMLAPGATHGD